jgi:hypothetical protein
MAWAWQQAKSAGDDWKSVWMPRYLGFVWPAFAVGLSVLILRLPTRPVRLAAIGLLLALNLVQFSVRVWGGSEPRTDLLAGDIAAAQPLSVRGQQLALDHLRVTQALLFGERARPEKLRTQIALQPLVAPDARVFVQTGFPSPAPGGGVMGSLPSRYYLCQLIGIDARPRELRRLRGVLDRQWYYTVGLSPKLIAADVRNRPAIRRIITWDRVSPGLSDLNRKDPVPAALGSAWRRVDERIYSARDHWTWCDLYQLRRREYVRVRDTPPEPPATRPATRTAWRR